MSWRKEKDTAAHASQGSLVFTVKVNGFIVGKCYAMANAATIVTRHHYLITNKRDHKQGFTS